MGGWKKKWRKILDTPTTEEDVCFTNEHSCAEKYYYEDDCVKCCEKTFPVATPNPTGACSTKRSECIANCMDVTGGICVPPSQNSEKGRK
ncbi:MAG: hypothetical protein WHV67_09010 [Thermoanaerobaculia bacterium]